MRKDRKRNPQDYDGRWDHKQKFTDIPDQMVSRATPISKSRVNDVKKSVKDMMSGKGVVGGSGRSMMDMYGD